MTLTLCSEICSNRFRSEMTIAVDSARRALDALVGLPAGACLEENGRVNHAGW